MIVTEQRYDRAALLSPVWVGDTLFVECFATRPGIYEYKNADGTITRELIRPEMLERTGAGLARLPVTLEHPKQDVDNINWSELGVGDVDGEVIQEPNGYQRLKLAVRRKDAQDDIMSHKRREVSPGYQARIDKTPGTHPEYGEYDAEQVGRVYNHLAIVRDARGGSRITIRTDSDSATMVDLIRGDAAQPREEAMAIDGRLLARLHLMGVDVRRVDSNERAVELLLDRMDMSEHLMGMVPDSEEESEDVYVNPHAVLGRLGKRAAMTAGGVGLAGAGTYAASSRIRRARRRNSEEEESGDGYYDSEGNEITQDEYLAGLEEENQAMRERLESEAEEEAQDELEPLAEDMDIPEEERGDALSTAFAIVSRLDGRRLHPSTPIEYVLGRIEQYRRDAGYVSGDVVWDAAAEAGRRHDSAPGPARLASGPSAIWTSQTRTTFEQRRDGGRK